MQFFYTSTPTRGIILDLVKDGHTKTFMNSLHTFSYPVIERNLVQIRHKYFVQTKIYSGASI